MCGELASGRLAASPWSDPLCSVSDVCALADVVGVTYGPCSAFVVSCHALLLLSLLEVLSAECDSAACMFLGKLSEVMSV